jgi:membrane-associated protease RseP (regulator of RpoE activity)
MREGRLSLTHIILFILTFFSTLVIGAFHNGVTLGEIINEPLRILAGIPFSFTLMLILLTHELSHYFASRYHHTRATLPYFIPAPTIFGTFGAFIKMTSPIRSRRALVDIGASGPIAGFVVSIVACAVGLSYSRIVPMPAGEAIHTIWGSPLLAIYKVEEQYNLYFGNSLLGWILTRIFVGVPPDGSIILAHPVAIAGWIGLFVTFLNLFPIGQLDGGHVAYALLGWRHRFVSLGLVVLLSLAGVFFWPGWIFWAVLMVILGLRHPPVMNWEEPLDPGRKLVGIIAIAIFVLTFIPVPVFLLGQ